MKYQKGNVNIFEPSPTVFKKINISEEIELLVIIKNS